MAPTVEASKPTAPVDEAAHQAATSPLNDTPQPTQAQAKAGNYKKGHLNWKGLDLTFENPKGSERKGVDPSGKAWSVKMPAHYGYLKRSTGADGDQVDIYMGDYPESDRVFVVDQKDADTGKWDEHKVMLGTRSLFEATRLYDQGFSDGRGKQRRSAVTPMTMAEFKTWLKDGDTTKPVAARPKAPAQSGSATPEVAVGGQSAPQTQGQTERTPDSALPARAAGPSSASGGQGSASPDGTPDKLAKPPPKPTGGKNLRSAAYERNPFLTFLAQHGLFNDKDKPGSQKSEFSPDKFILVPGYGMVFRRTGLMPDVMVARAIEDGYLPKDGTESQLADLIRRAIAGEKIEPMYAEGVAEAKGQRMSDDRRALEEERQQEQNAIADVANLADPSVLDDDIPIDEASNTSTEAAMRSLGFTEQEIQDAITAGQGGAQEDRARGGEPDETQAAGPGEGDQGRPGAPPAGAEQEGLTAPTRADVLTQQDRAEAEAQRKADGGDKPAPPKPITADTPDMFNTQGSVFDQPAEPDAASFIPAPDGGIDYGEITDEMSKAMRRQAGKIRLQQGDKEFGLTHIQSRHGEQIQRMGFADVPAFVFDALQRIESIWKPDATSQLVVIQAEEKGRAVFIQLMPGKEDSGDFYTVNTAFPTGKGFAQNKDGWVSLWSREPVPAGDTGKPPSFAAPADETGQQGTMVSNQSEGGSVPQPPQDGNAATQVATILDAANVTGSEPTNDIEPDPEHNRLKGLSVSVEVPIDGGSAKVTHDAQRVMLDLDRRAQALEAVWERCK